MRYFNDFVRMYCLQVFFSIYSTSRTFYNTCFLTQTTCVFLWYLFCTRFSHSIVIFVNNKPSLSTLTKDISPVPLLGIYLVLIFNIVGRIQTQSFLIIYVRLKFQQSHKIREKLWLNTCTLVRETVFHSNSH